MWLSVEPWATSFNFPDPSPVWTMEYRRFFNVAHDFLCVAGVDGYFRSINQRWSEVLGYEESELLKNPFFEVFHNKDVDLVKAELLKLTRGIPTVNFKIRLKKADGNYVYTQWNATPDDKNELFYAIGRDITDDYRNSKLLAETGRVGKVGGWELDVTSQQTFWTNQVFDIYGIVATKDNIVPVSVGIDAYHVEDQKAITDAITQAGTKGKPFDLKLRIIRANDKKVLWVRAKGEAVRNDLNDISHITGTFQDIDEEYKRAQNLDELNKRFALALNATSDAVWDWMDIEKNEEWWSDSLYSLLGYSKSELTPGAATFQELIHPDDVKRMKESLHANFEGKAVFNCEYRLKTKHDGYKWFLGKGDCIRDESGKAVRMIGVISDLTEVKKVQQKLKITNEELEQFIFLTSHVLQEPASKVKLFNQILASALGADLSQKDAEILNQSIDSSEKLSRYIKDLLQYTELFNLKASAKKVELVEVVRKVSDSIKKKALGVNIELEALEPILINGAEERLEFVFNELIQNSIQFKDFSSPLNVSVKLKKCLDEQKVVITYCDNGTSIDPKFSKDIFKPFKKLHLDEKSKSSGMGLAMVKRIVENHNGTIMVEHDKGKGTCFKIELNLVD